MTTVTQAPPPIDEELLARMIKMIMSEGGTFQGAFNVSDLEMKAMYARGYELQKQRQFVKAMRLFEYLCYLDHYEESYWIALGFCREQTRDYRKALQAYVMAGMLDGDNPVPPLRSAECLMHLGELPAAKRAAEMTVSIAGEDPRLKQRRERAEFLLKTIDKRQKKRAKT